LPVSPIARIIMEPVMNQTESKIFELLRDICDSNGFRVLSKMRLADVLPINHSGLPEELYRFALIAHFDFIVTNTGKKALLSIEFDGPTHLEPSQIERDNKKNQISKHFGLKLLRLTGATLPKLRSLVEAQLGIVSAPTEVASKKKTRLGKQCKKCEQVFIVQDSSDPLPDHNCVKLSEMKEQPQRKKQRTTIIAGSVALISVVVTVIIIAASGKKEQPQTKEAGPQPTPVVQVVVQPATQIADKPKEEVKTSNPIETNAATEKQFVFLKSLANRKGWKEAELDKKTELTLGYRRKFAEINKKEASSLIEAWK
jgi:Protein of unknown function (DUF2726)